MRETDRQLLDPQARMSLASTAPASLSASLKLTKRSASVASSRFPFRRQQTEDTDAVLTGRWKGPPPLSAKQATSPSPRVAWTSSPLAKSHGAFQFYGHSEEMPQVLAPHVPSSVEAPLVATTAKAPQATAALTVVEEDVDTEAIVQESEDDQVTTQATALGEGYYRTSDGFLEAEV